MEAGLLCITDSEVKRASGRSMCVGQARNISPVSAPDRFEDFGLWHRFDGFNQETETVLLAKHTFRFFSSTCSELGQCIYLLLAFQDEEKFRNKTMFDILFVRDTHPLTAQIAFLYQILTQSSTTDPYVIPIDPAASGGMNGFLCLTERNWYSVTVMSPVKGFNGIVNNRVLNATYLNPQYHQHIPEPPVGAIIPPKILKPSDFKPFPVLWHEDNSRRQSRNRPQVSGSLSGPLLGEAAYRLVKNSLQRKSGNSAALLDMPYRGAPCGSGIRPRPSGPLGYERGSVDNPYHAHMSRSVPNPHPQFYGSTQANRQLVRIMKKPNTQSHNAGIDSSMSKLTIQEGPRPPHQNNRMQNSGHWPTQPLPNHNAGSPPQRPMQNNRFTQQRSAQTAGFTPQRPVQMAGFPQQRPVNGIHPPLPPSNWIGKQPSGGHMGVTAKQDPKMTLDRQPKQDSLRLQHDRRQATKVVYRVKTPGTNGNGLSESGNREEPTA